jgi:hypothetical protein
MLAWCGRSGGGSVGDEPAQEVLDFGRLTEGEGGAGVLGEPGHEDPGALSSAAKHLHDPRHVRQQKSQTQRKRERERKAAAATETNSTLKASSSVRSSPM